MVHFFFAIDQLIDWLCTSVINVISIASSQCWSNPSDDMTSFMTPIKTARTWPISLTTEKQNSSFFQLNVS